MSQFKELNKKNSYINNELLNQSERNSTVLTDNKKYSTFDKSFQQATTFNSGKLIPILMQVAYPGDTYKIKTDCLIRLAAQASTPFMNINYDVNFFFVPFEQIDPDFKILMGETTQSGYQPNNLKLPKLLINASMSPNNMYTENDLANYFNIPINVDFYLPPTSNTGLNNFQIYPFLAYGKIWNDWYKDQNLQENIDILTWNNFNRSVDYSDYINSSTKTFYESIIYGKGLAPVSKLPDYFTNCLPYQQKGQPITIGISNFILPQLPVSNIFPSSSNPGFVPKWYGSSLGGGSVPNGVISPDNNGNQTIITSKPSGSTVLNNAAYLSLATVSQKLNTPFPTITELRNSITLQHLLEIWALCGSRYVEQLKSIWGIEIDPKNINRSEIIGGFNDTLTFSNVVQTSSTVQNSQLGNIASNLYNNVSINEVQYTAKQHGLILGLLCCRTLINYGAQGFPKFFAYNDYLDFYNPQFIGISEQPIYEQEIQIRNGTNVNFLEYPQFSNVFGYNEPFLDTKFNINNGNGYFSLHSKTSLFKLFLFGESYLENVPPTLNDEWIQYNPNIIGNTLYDVSPNTKEFYHQFIALFTFDIKYTTQQPLYNKPGVYKV